MVDFSGEMSKEKKLLNMNARMVIPSSASMLQMAQPTPADVTVSVQCVQKNVCVHTAQVMSEDKN